MNTSETSNYRKLLEGHGWGPGPDQHPDYRDLLSEPRATLCGRSHLDELDRIGILARLGIVETVRRFGRPREHDDDGRAALTMAATYAALLHEEGGEVDVERYRVARRYLSVWEAERFRPSAARLDQILRQAADEDCDRIATELVAGTMGEVEPAASFQLSFAASLTEDEAEKNKRLMVKALRRHDPGGSLDHCWLLSDEDMVGILDIIERTVGDDDPRDRALFERGSARRPMGPRSALVLNVGHAVNGLRDRISLAEVTPLVAQVRTVFGRGGRRYLQRGKLLGRGCQTITAGADEGSIELEDLRSADALARLEHLDQVAKLDEVLELLRGGAAPGTTRRQLLDAPDLIKAVLGGELSHANVARRLGRDESTVREAMARVRADLHRAMCA